MQLQLVDQVVLRDDGLVQHIEGILDMGKPDFEFGNPVIQHVIALLLLLRRYARCHFGGGAHGDRHRQEVEHRDAGHHEDTGAQAE